MGLESLLKDVKTIAVVCNQWGDTGKGKFSDYFASQWAEVTARGTGGSNAGHTVTTNGAEHVFHLIPAGILNDAQGQYTVLGNGMVIDLSVLSDELDTLDTEGLTYDRLLISKDAHVVMPYHQSHDRARNQSQKGGGIGSTGRGIGPCYADKIARRGIRISDLFNREVLAQKINAAKEMYSGPIRTDEIIDTLAPLAERIHPFVRDTIGEMHWFMRNEKRILLEGAQGLLLGIEHGTYPYVTSSDCSLNGTASGVGLSASMIDLPLGIVKFPFMTRVGGGPFPTELGGRDSEAYCADEHTRANELTRHKIPHKTTSGGVIYDRDHPTIREMMNADDAFIQGVGIRLSAGEYGATTGRPRRVGWTDAVIARYATGINGPRMVLTKSDALAGIEQFKIAYEYEKKGQTIDTFPRDAEALRSATPIYQTYTGYGDISGVREYDGLPESLRVAIHDLEVFTRGEVVAVSVGADRDATIVR